MVAKFEAFKLKKAGDVKIITLKIDGKKVVVDEQFDKSTKWEDFCANSLGEAEPRYVLLDHDYTTTDGRSADKIIMVAWNPDTGPVMKKMKYAGTKEAVKSALQGIAININATDLAECSLAEINTACTKI